MQLPGGAPCSGGTFFTLLGGAIAWPVIWPLKRSAQTGYPDRPITLIVPYAPGGGNDVVARAVAEPMSKSLGQPIVIENRGGAGGSVGTRQVAKAAPDGYTLGLGGTGTLAIDPTLYPNVGYDPRKDFAPVGLIATSPLIVLVNQSVPAHNVKDLIELAKKQPGKLNYASAGTGSGIHLGTVLFAETTGINITHIPYKGSGPALTDLLGGHVQIYFSSLPPAIGLVKDGKLRALGVTSLKRSDVISGCSDGRGARAARLRGRAALWDRRTGWDPATDHRQTQCSIACGVRPTARSADHIATEGAEPLPMSLGRICGRHRPRGNQVVGAGEKIRRDCQIATVSLHRAP